MPPIINNEFTNISGKKYNLVREVAFIKGGLMHNLGNFITQTQREKTDFFDPSEDLNNDGVYIYQSYHNPNIGYRIYQEFADYNFNGYRDDFMIQNLQERQSYIKQSHFPTGVVTLDKKIIGQEMPYYPETITLYEFFCKEKIKNPIVYYQKVLSILKEMTEYGIYYLDAHPKNFVIDKDKNIQVIDFDPHYMRFDNIEMEKKILQNYKKMIYILSRKWNSEIKIEWKDFSDFEDIEENLIQIENVFIKKS